MLQLVQASGARPNRRQHSTTEPAPSRSRLRDVNVLSQPKTAGLGHSDFTDPKGPLQSSAFCLLPSVFCLLSSVFCLLSPMSRRDISAKP
jgi:hypothetical protein